MHNPNLKPQTPNLKSTEDTICAPATAPGGALGIIRVSGPEALAIVGSVCHSVKATTPANTVHYTHITASVRFPRPRA